MAEDLALIEPWIGGLLARLKPGQRRRLSVKIGRHLRKANAERIARNVEPDGAKMEPRKPRQRRGKRKAGRVKGKGRMFPKIARARSLKPRAHADGVELGFAPGMVARTAAEHHLGLEGRVGRSDAGRTIRTRYPARRLLGFGPDDPDAIMDLVLDHLTG